MFSQVSTMMDDNIIEEVLLRLPPKSLTRCKSLSKEWHHFISHNQSFRRSYLSRNRVGGSPLMLGFFFSKNRSDDVEEQLRFLPTSTEGKSMPLLLKGRKRDEEKASSSLAAVAAPSLPFPLDESLSFLGHESIHVVASSNGFLLCSLEEKNPMHYLICNPVNKQCIKLPTPKTNATWVAHGFICHAMYPCLEKPHSYKVVRGIQPGRVRLNIEIFSSELPEWKLYLNLTCPSPFVLDKSGVLAVISEQGVIYWLASCREQTIRGTCLLEFDPRKECVELLEFPRPSEKGGYRVEFFGESAGLTIYAHHQFGQLSIWAFNEKGDCTKKWSLRCKVSLEMKMESYPECIQRPGHVDYAIVAFHPLNPQVLFLYIPEKMLLYDVENSRMEVVCNFVEKGWTQDYFAFPYAYGVM